MNKKTFSVLITAISLIITAALMVWANDYFAWFKRGLKANKLNEQSQTIPYTTSTQSGKYVVEEVMSGLNIPWSLVFTDANRILVSERPGTIRAIVDGKLENSVLYQFTETSTKSEEGLMSLALAPEYKFTKVLYAAVAYQDADNLWIKVVSLIDQGHRLVLGKTIIDKIPGAQYHAGTALSFGPDGKLYISTGDSSNGKLAQDLNSLAGKILRINPDGTIPKDNPFPNSPVYSYGHRNPQGLAWLNGKLYSSEHGPSLFDGPAGGDEINLILPGKNYGWPLVSHEKTMANTETPLTLFTPAEAPASLMAYTGKALPQFTNNLFFGALKGEGVVRLVLDPKEPGKIITIEKLAGIEYGRIRAITQGPDGAIYFSTSNRDGRGDAGKTDDRIFRIRPQ